MSAPAHHGIAGGTIEIERRLTDMPQGEYRGMDRRQFLRRAAAAGIALPSISAILAACGDDGGDAGGALGPGGTEIQLARPDAPVTLPVTEANPPIEGGLDPESGPLRIFGYNDYIWRRVRNRFAERYGVDVEYTVFDTPEEMVARLRSGGSNFDLIVSVTLENVGKLAYGGLIQPLNRSYIPNFSNVWADLQDPYYDVGSQYTAPYTVYTTGIIYQNDKVEDDIAAMENPYDIFWDQRYANEAHLLNGSRDLLSVPLLREDRDINTTDDAELEEARQSLLDGVGAMNWKFDHVDYNELGDFAIHQTWSGQVVYYQYYLPQNMEIEQFTYVWPEETSDRQGISMNDVFAIPTGAANPVLAHKMIDFLLEPEFALLNYSYEGYQPPIEQFDPEQVVADGLVPEHVSNILMTEEDLAAGVQQLELPAEATQRYESIYQEVTGGA
jgi:spermidine/putrescine transport system substrate-binding protein